MLLGAGACAPKSDPAAPGISAPGRSTPRPSASAPSAELGPLPPMATMPPPGVATSRKANVTHDASLSACLSTTSSANATNDGPASRVRKIAEGCAAASGMTALGPPVEGRQADKDRAAEQPLHVDANRCYRVYVATDPSVHDAVVVARDSAGAVVATSAAAALPEDGAMCFTSADDVTILVGVGSGEGRYATQVWRR